MRKVLFSTTASLALAVALPATPSQITLGNDTAGTYDFTGSPPASLSVGSQGLVGAGEAFFPPDAGTYTFGPLPWTPAGPLVGGDFPTAGTQDFSVTMADGDSLAGIVSWSLLKDHSAHPDLDGILSISSAGGDAAWLSVWHAGVDADIDLALSLFPGPLLDDLAADGGGQWATISSGEIVPRAVDEPTGLAILGAALIGMFWLRGKLA